MTAHRAILAAIALERFAWYLFLGSLALWRSPAEVGALLFWGYLAPMLGGLSGRYSLRGSVLAGVALLSAGYAAAVAGYFALPLLALGCGLFKPCLSALLGTQFAEAIARSKAFGRYYSAIQIGSMPSTLVGGFLHYRYGWAATHAAALVGTGLSLVVVLVAWHKLQAPRQSISEAIIDHIAPARWGRLAALCAGAVLFFAGFQQQQTTLVLWARDVVRADLPESVSTLNPVFCALLLATPLGAWAHLRSRLVCAMLALAAAFALLLLNDRMSGLVAWYFAATVGEVLISPLGLDAASSLVPRRHASLATALWLSSMALGGWLAGHLGGMELRAAASLSLCLSLLGAAWFALLIREPAEVAQVELRGALCPV